MNHPVEPAGRQPLAVRRNGHGVQRVGRRVQRLNERPGRRVPHFDRAGIAARNQPPAVRREDDALDAFFPPFQDRAGLSRRRIPETHAVEAARRQLDAVRRPRQRQHARPMAVERVNDLARGCVPDLDGVIVTGRGQAPAVRPERHGRHGGPMALQLLDGLRLGRTGGQQDGDYAPGGCSTAVHRLVPPGSAGRQGAESRKRRR